MLKFLTISWQDLISKKWSNTSQLKKNWFIYALYTVRTGFLLIKLRCYRHNRKDECYTHVIIIFWWYNLQIYYVIPNKMVLNRWTNAHVVLKMNNNWRNAKWVDRNFHGFVYSECVHRCCMRKHFYKNECQLNNFNFFFKIWNVNKKK